jgi:GMP synthase-like glutamine amidotransferase
VHARPGRRSEPSILVLQHAGCEPPGVYSDELGARGIATETVLLDEQPLPRDWGRHAGIVVMGGAMGAYEEDRHPWLRGEKRLIAEAVAAGTPYWGVCLGAQMLAASLGARVMPGPRPELGVLPVKLTDAAARDPVFATAPLSFPSLQWHGDTYELPKGAVQLARSEAYEQQAFVVGRAYALQFHLEVDAPLAEEWMEIPAYVDELERLEGTGTPGRLVGEVRRAEAQTVPLARELFARWLVHVAGVGA